jgi:hypothetical protein
MSTRFHIRGLMTVGVLALVACHEVMPSSPVEWESPPTTYPTTYLRGRVMEFGTNVPLAGVAVIRDTTQTMTNAEGYYNFTIENGFQIMLTAAKAGYDTTSVALALRGGDQVMDLRLVKQ